MKVIDLLNKIANNEDVPEKINYEGVSYTYDDYITDYKRTFGKDLFTYLFTENRTETFLNDEVEVIEDKKIDKLQYSKLEVCPDLESLLEYVNENREEFRQKINEIIDKITKGE